MKAVTTKEFLERAVKVHGDKYDYSQVECYGWLKKIEINCKVHGKFLQNMGDHLQGKGCKKCGTENKIDFWNKKDEQFLIENYAIKGCKFCSQVLNRTRKAVRERARILKITKKPIPRLKHPNISSIIWANVLKGAKARSLCVEIEFDDIWQLYLQQDKKCALTGFDVYYSLIFEEITASLDRIDSNLGYTKDNIQIVHKDINRMKNHFSDEYFYKMCRAISNYRPDLIDDELVFEENEWLETSIPVRREKGLNGEFIVKRSVRKMSEDLKYQL